MTKLDQELKDLLTYFESAVFPDTPFSLNKYLVVNDVRQLIDSTVAEIKRYRFADENVKDSMFKHLRELKAICEEKNQL